MTENAKSFTSSFGDWIQNLDDTDYLPWPYEPSDFEFDDDTEASYTDPDYAFEFVDLFFNSERLFFYGDDVTLFDIYAINQDLTTYFKLPEKPEIPDIDPVGPGPIGPEPEFDPAEEI